MPILDVKMDRTNMTVGNALSNWDLTVVTASTSTYIIATDGKIKGKWYWEVRLNSGAVSNAYIGVANVGFKNGTSNWSYKSGSGLKGVVGDLIGVALDMDDYKLGFYRNGIEEGAPNKNLEILDEVYPFLGSGTSASKSLTVNFGATPFAYSIPNGYEPYLNDYVRRNLILSKGTIKSIKEENKTNVVPKMTSNTTPSGIASASSEHTASYGAWRAFDSSWIGSANRWIAMTATGWLRYDFGSGVKKVIGKYSIRGIDDIEMRANPKDWTFEGSNDGVVWTVLDTQINQISWTPFERREFRIKNNTGFQNYRINITANNGAPSNITISKLEMIERTNVSLVNLPSQGESDFLTHGIDSLILFDTCDSVIDIVSDNATLGTGKTFGHTIDLSKRKLNKVVLN